MRAGSPPVRTFSRAATVALRPAGGPVGPTFRRPQSGARTPASSARRTGLGEPVALHTVRRSRLRRIGIVLMLGLLLWMAPGWYFGVPMLRAWSDLTAMASLGAGRSAPPVPAAIGAPRTTFEARPVGASRAPVVLEDFDRDAIVRRIQAAAVDLERAAIAPELVDQGGDLDRTVALPLGPDGDEGLAPAALAPMTLGEPDNIDAAAVAPWEPAGSGALAQPTATTDPAIGQAAGDAVSPEPQAILGAPVDEPLAAGGAAPAVEPPPADLAPVVTSEPTAEPTVEPTLEPTLEPTAEPTPTLEPTAEPTPTFEPTATLEPTSTVEPTATLDPTAEPTPTLEPTATLEPAPEITPEPAGAQTILILGIDARANEGTLGRSDVVMLARVDPERQRAALLSLPRDLWVTIPNFGEGKLGTAYYLGEMYGEGAAVARETVSLALGITIDKTAVIDFNGFRGLIDTVGGIAIDVPRELYDPAYPTEDYGYTVAHFTPGVEVMNGERALMYARIRHVDSDFERVNRQQAVVIGVAQKLRERGILQNLREADQLTGALRSYVRTDLEPKAALSLMWSMRSFDLAAVERVRLDPAELYDSGPAGGYSLIASPAALQALGAQLVGAQ